MTDLTDDQVKALLDGATPGRRVQFHGSYCPEAVGTPFSDWDTSHDMSVIRPDGSRYRLAHYKHASDAYLSQMAPDLARALLDARAELARVKADAAAAMALMVAQAADACVDLAAKVSNAALTGLPEQARLRESMEATFTKASHVIRALAPADGLAAENASLKAREKVDANLLLAAYKGLLVLHRMLSKSGLSVGAETATYITDQIAAAHPEMPGLASLRAAPTDPGDGWTWNERLGWIGPDGKPADPRRRW